MLFVSCSKPPAEPHKTEDSTPSQIGIKQIESPAATAPQPNPTAVTASTEEIAEYAGALGIDAVAAHSLLEKENAFSYLLVETAKKSSPQEIYNLVASHLNRLDRGFEIIGAYQSHSTERLPAWWMNATSRDGVESLSIVMNKPGYLDIGKEYLVDQRISYGTVFHVAKTNPDLLSRIVESRASVTPSPSDAILYQGILNGLADNSSDHHADSSGPDADRAGANLVRQMATAKNPIYRLIAVEQANRLNSTDRLGLYESFIEEKDPQIKQRAIEGLAQTGSSAAIDILRRFEQASLNQGQKENADLAAKAVKRLQTTTP